MGILTPFTSPHDIRWQGPQRLHHIIFLIKNFILLLFIIFVIVEYALFKHWWDNPSYGEPVKWEYSPYEFWFRIGLALIPDVVITLLSLILILNPLHRSTYSFHPVFALVSSIVMFCLWAQVAWLNPLIAYSNEVSFDNWRAWMNIVYGECAVQALICLIWLAMMAYSCVAVHRWRKAKKDAKRGVDLERRDAGGN